jgi:hypothetical protein
MSLLLPATAAAQAGGSISGLVEDSTGGILPGVTVEAASPVLIEGRLSAVTDGNGRYTIVNLRPGTYTVTFALEGFNRFVREGIILTGDMAVQVNVQMTVGALEQSITVSGQSPLVDVQQVRNQFVATREMMDVLPGASTFAGRALLIPGVRNTGMGEGQYWPATHGNTWRDAQTTNDGMRANVIIDDGQWQMGWEMNQAATAELAYEAGGAPAEVQTGGVVQNAIPREGGNTFSGTWHTQFGHESLSNDNATPELRQQLGELNRLNYSYDTNPGFGGPILRDKLWFFGAFRRTDWKNWQAGSFFTGEGTPEQRERNGFPAAGEQGYWRTWMNSGLLRLTNQITDRHKWRIGFERINRFYPLVDTDKTRAPESADRIPQPVGYHAQARWTSTLTNRLLLEAGFATQFNKWRREQFEWNEGQKSAYNNLANNTWQGAFWITGHQPEYARTVKASISYVTGSHNFKAGFENRWGYLGLDHGPIAGDVRTYFYFNPSGNYDPLTNTGLGFPIGAMVLATPLGNFSADINHDTGVYAQDTWTLGRWTLNLGARLDSFRSSVPPQSAPAGAWVGARDFPAIPGAKWNTIVPRLGVSYDLFGNGKTALKAMAHKYVNQEATTLAMAANPMASFTWSARQEFRAWTDLDGNGSAVGADGSIQYNEVGQSPNRNWGTVNDAARAGVDDRPGQWEFNTQVQHELVPGLSVGFGYYRRDYHNLWREDNILLSDGDYTPFTITGPVHEKLGQFSGQTLPLYTLPQGLFGQSERLIRNATNDRTYDGVEWTAQGRFGNGGFFGGSVTYERTFENTCDVEDRNNTLWCDHPRAWQTQFKGHVAYPIPGGVMASAFVQGYPGPDIQATYNITSAIAGRTVFTPTTQGRISLNLLPREVFFLPYQTKVDLRFMRRFQVGNTRFAPLVDIFNLLNANTVTAINQTCCTARWQEVLTIMQPRFFRVGFEVDW